ncbi:MULTISPECIES: hypothetical protein [unclassified Mesorhizobium]|uniref:hypothetical protein n=1 Tax=unclassified Mesorhizobium TaxID=325217 RepID=UPI0015E275B6|nr:MULTISPECIES: hypothetical protein [unclassified Mesorhizobium]
MLPSDVHQAADLAWHPDFDHVLLAPPGCAKPRHTTIVTDSNRVPDYLYGSVLMLGNFDGLHVGHQRLLDLARRTAALMGAPVGVMSCEPHPRQFFNPELVGFRLSSIEAKTVCFGRLGIDMFFMPKFDRSFADLSPSEFVARILVRQLGVRSVVVGPDFCFGSARAGDVSLLEQLGRAAGFTVLTVPEHTVSGERVSSTLVRRWMAAGLLDKVSAALGDNWLLPATVGVGGSLSFDAASLRPPHGAYDANVWTSSGDPIGRYRIDLSDQSARLLTTVEKPFRCLLSGWENVAGTATG